VNVPPLIGTSLKMHFTSTEAGQYFDRLRDLTAGITATDLFVLPPFTSIWVARQKLSGSRIAWGAQDVSTEDSGPHTGDVSAPMLADLGCTYVEAGHAERRRAYGETDEQVAIKVARILAQDMIAIVCVGETTKSDSQTAIDHVVRQLRTCLAPIEPSQRGRLVVAYEPVWAIGSGAAPATPKHVAAVHRGIHEYLCSPVGGGVDARVIYGGSLDPTSAKPLLDQDGVDGLFVGRAALDPVVFARIAAAADSGRAGVDAATTPIRT
jgi:triosephosphate isomerase